MRKYIAEATGTFALVFCGTGAIVINQYSGGQIGHAGIAVTFGLIVTAMIYAFGKISGAHFNPAVTLGFGAAGLFSLKSIPAFIISQVAGALMASVMLKFLFPENNTLGATLPSGSEMQSFWLELILSFLLMLVILFTSTGARETGIMAGLAIGGTVLLEAMFAGPVSGASMNPARSLAPALVSGHLTSLWIYIAAPVTGCFIAALMWRAMKEQRNE